MLVTIWPSNQKLQVKKSFTKDDIKKETHVESYFESFTNVTNFHRRVRKETDGAGQEPFTRDIYDMGRTILAILDNQHKIPYDDVEAQEHYKSGEPFEDNVQHLYQSDPLVGHLIKHCLACEVSAKEMFNHFCFYEDGTYLEFMQRFNDIVKVSQQLWAIKTSCASQMIWESVR
ncbi:hypothetical protein Tco_0579345 [Tanacetum coccineum]